MKQERFTAMVLDGHKDLAFEIPFDPGAQWGTPEVRLWPGRRGYCVNGTVNRVRFESVVVPRARRFFVLVAAEMRKAGNLRRGSSVKVALGPAG
jgi:uncharacterized protein DUF1905